MAEWLNGAKDEHTATNRWFEKVMHFVVWKDGKAGLSGEHAPLDAPMVGAVVDAIVPLIENNKLPAGVKESPQYAKVQWNLDSNMKQELAAATTEAYNVLKNCENVVMQYPHYGAKWIKAVAGTSPDAYFQMSLQLAYYLLHKESSATYETGTARAFYHGRTDTVRTCSVDSQNFTHAMVDKNLSVEEKRQKLQIALDSHSKYMKRATDGKVIDRHFLGLRKVLQPGEEMPEMFKDPIWRESTRFRISTSNMTGGSFIPGFGPTEQDGYGLCYQTRDDILTCGIASFRSCSKTSAKQFSASLQKALDEMRALYKEPAKL